MPMERDNDPLLKEIAQTICNVLDPNTGLEVM
jgi:hypothetical protein